MLSAAQESYARQAWPAMIRRTLLCVLTGFAIAEDASSLVQKWAIDSRDPRISYPMGLGP